jgi:hypothetical protein
MDPRRGILYLVSLGYLQLEEIPGDIARPRTPTQLQSLCCYALRRGLEDVRLEKEVCFVHSQSISRARRRYLAGTCFGSNWRLEWTRNSYKLGT